jgi:type II secretory pathway component PulJ
VIGCTCRKNYLVMIALALFSIIGCGGGSKSLPAMLSPSIAATSTPSLGSALLPSGVLAQNAMGILPKDIHQYIATHSSQFQSSFNGLALFTQSLPLATRKTTNSQGFPYYDPCNPQGSPPAISYSLVCAQLNTVELPRFRGQCSCLSSHFLS